MERIRKWPKVTGLLSGRVETSHTAVICRSSCFSILPDNHFMTIDSEALDQALRIQLCRRQSLLVDLSVLGETDMQTGCLILSESDKSYRGKKHRVLWEPDWAIRECFPGAVIST